MALHLPTAQLWDENLTQHICDIANFQIPDPVGRGQDCSFDGPMELMQDTTGLPVYSVVAPRPPIIKIHITGGNFSGLGTGTLTGIVLSF